MFNRTISLIKSIVNKNLLINDKYLLITDKNRNIKVNVKIALKIEFIEKTYADALNSENLYDILLIVNIKSINGDFYATIKRYL